MAKTLLRKVKKTCLNMSGSDWWLDGAAAFLRFLIKRNPIGLFKKDFNRKHPYWAASTSLVIIIAILSGSIWFAFLRVPKSQAAWWNDSWAYRKSVTVSNNSTYAASNIPYRVILDTQSLISAGKMKSDGSDLRVVDINGKSVRFQLEKSTLNTSTTGIWIEGNVDAKNSAAYFIYYGNQQASQQNFASDISSVANNGETVEMKDGYGYSTDASYGKISDMRKDGTNLGVNGTYRYTDSYPGNWWDDRQFSRTLLSQGPMFVEVKYEDTSYGSYSSFGTIVKMFRNGFTEEMVYMNYNASGTENLYYYLNFDTATRNSVWVNGSGTLVDQAADSGTLYQADLGDNWFGQRWTADGKYCGTIINKNNSDWHHGYTSAQNSYFQTNYSTSEAFSAGGSRQIRYGTFAGNGGIDEMKVKGSTYGANSSNVGNEEQAPAPVAYWKFDEGNGTMTNDSTSNGFNGTITGAAWKNSSECLNENCLYFDGQNSGDYVNLGNSSKLNPSNFSVSAWVNYKGDPSYSYGYIYSNARDCCGAYNGIELRIAGGRLSGTIWNSTSAAVTDPSSFPFNQWTQVTFSYDGDVMRLYVNGKEVASQSSTLGVGTPASYNSAIGGMGMAPGTYTFKGYIDEVKIYPFARSAEQIKMDYNSGLAGSGAAEGAAQSFGGKSDKWLSDGLVGHWKMDETSWNGTAGEVKDASGVGNNGTASGGATISVAKYGNGGSFDGTDDYVDMGNPAHYQFINTSSFSMSAWIKTNDLSGFEHIIGKGYGNYRLAKYNNIISFRLSSNQLIAETSSLLNTNDWFHVVAVYDGNTKNAKIYVNGQQQANSTNTSVNWTSTSDNFQIGNSPNESYYFNGKIDEARTYNRALSPEEIRKLYDWAPGPIAYYKLDEKTGTTFSDTGGNGSPGGTLVNSPSWITGKYGSGLGFASNYATITDNASLRPGAGDFTIGFWIKTPFANIGGSGSWPNIFLKGLTTSAPSGTWGFLGNSNTTNRINFSQSSDAGGSFDASLSTAALSDGWHYIVARRTGTTTQLYADGVFVGEDTTAGSNLNSTANFYVGGNTADTTYFSGNIDEIKYYNYARTTDQIVEDMNGGGSDADSGGGTIEPMMHWKFDEGSGTVIQDSTSNNNDGTLTNSPVWSNDGKNGKALRFNGSDNNVTRAAPVGMSASKGTISFWSKRINISTVGSYIFAHPQTGDNSRIYVVYTANSNTLNCTLGNGTGIGSTSLNLNQWYHVTVAWNGTSAKFYVDGKLIGANTFNGLTSVGAIYAGGYPGGNQNFDGLIDDLKIYNATLSEEEIKADFNQGKSAVMSMAGMTVGGGPDGSANAEYCVPGDSTSCSAPVGEWKFDEKSGTTVSDTGSGGRNATLTNGPTWTTGKFGSAAQFDGSDDSALLASTINLSGSSDWTASAWIKTANTGINSVLSNNSGGPVTNDIRIESSKIAYAHYNGSWLYEFGTSNVADNKWHYLSWVNHSNQTMDLYVDGKAESLGVSSAQSTGPINSIGRNWFRSFNGSIDNVKIYNYARTPAQVAYDYNRGAPIGWWKLDECQGETIYDSSGNGNNGTWSGSGGEQTSIGTCTNTGTAWGDGVNGKFNGSLNFDTTDDFVRVSSNSVLNYPKALSVSAWVKSKDVSQNQTVISRNAPFFLRISSEKFRVGVYTGSWLFQNGSINLINDTWHHLVLTYDGAYVKSYVDGVLDVNAAKTGDMISFNNLYFGFTPAVGENYPMNGQIDDVRVYNYALTNEQIKNVMNEGSALRFGQ